MKFLLLSGLALTVSALAQPTAAELAAAYAQRTVVLYNATLPKSKELAEYYVEQRQIPRANLVGLNCATDEEIQRGNYDATIKDPLRAIFTERGWWKLGEIKGTKMCVQTSQRIMAVMQGIPLRIWPEKTYGPPDPKTQERAEISPTPLQANAACVDAELSAFGLVDAPSAGPISNPYFGKSDSFITQEFAPFFLVSRIDGPTYEIAKGLIDDALAVEKIGLYGKTYIDFAQKTDPGYKEGEDWLLSSAKTLANSGFPMIADVSPSTFPTNYPMNDAAVYLGWYQLPADGPFLNPKFRFKRGAIACHLHSFSATTLRHTDSGWAALFLSQGATGVFGNVFEPYLSLTIHFDKLTDRLLRGFTLAEAASMATPACSWMNVVIGDPLYRPFQADIDHGKTDPEYRLLRQTMRDNSMSNGSSAKLLSKLETSAQELKSGTLYESLAQIAMGSPPLDHARILKYLTAAQAAYAKAADQIRVVLVRADYLQLNDQKSAAIKLLKASLTQYAQEPEAKAMAERLAALKAQ